MGKDETPVPRPSANVPPPPPPQPDYNLITYIERAQQPRKKKAKRGN